MRKKVFSQLDPRWSGLPYPKKPYTIGTSGCGCCSVTHVIIESDKYKNYTPKNVQPYIFNPPQRNRIVENITH